MKNTMANFLTTSKPPSEMIKTPKKTPAKSASKSSTKLVGKTPTKTPRRTPKKSMKTTPPKSNKRNTPKREEPKCQTIDSFFTVKKKNIQRQSLKSTIERINEGPLKGLPTTLLEKIKKPQESTEETSKAERRLALKKLPELIRIVHCYFLMQPKPAPLGLLVEKCIHSYYTFISVGEVEKQIDLMVEVLSDWIQICQVRQIKYVKIIDKSRTFNQLAEKVQKLIECV